MINARFKQEAQARQDFENKFKAIVNDRFDTLKADISKETQTRIASINSLKQCIESDFEKIENEMQETEKAAENTDNELNKIFDDLLDRVNDENDQIKKETSEIEEGLLERLKEVGKIKEEIETEKVDREKLVYLLHYII